jgi:UDP-N-acetylmuramoylalanine--D-glutamate ligase
VLELSSYQLAGGGGFETPHAVVARRAAAAVLNLTQDHLDWHGSMAAYAAAKARIFGQHAVLVINRDDAAVEALVPAPLVVKGSGKARMKTVAREVVRFGLTPPQRPGDFGLVVENGMAWLVRALPADAALKKGERVDEEGEIHLQRLMPADALRVRGRHNAANALAALALATAIGCPLAPMLHGLREYAGEPHRVQWVATVGEVDAYDDSKGTNVGATVAAIEGLGADKAPARLLLILGGDGKGQDFAPLAAPLARHARAVATIGRDAALIEAAVADALHDAGVPLQRHDTLPDAVQACFAHAEPGDAVLLSPACASWDMFGGYAERAAVFVKTVQALAAQRGDIA